MGYPYTRHLTADTCGPILDTMVDPPPPKEQAGRERLKERTFVPPSERAREEMQRQEAELAVAAAAAAEKRQQEEEEAEAAELNLRLSEHDLCESKARLLREAAAAAYRSGRFEHAARHFSRALALPGISTLTGPEGAHTLYGSRSACKSALKDYEGALADAKQAISLAPEAARGHLRQAAALHGLCRWDMSIRSYEEARQLDAEGREARAINVGLYDVRRRRELGGGQWHTVVEGWAEAMPDPELNAAVRMADGTMKSPPKQQVLTKPAHLSLLPNLDLCICDAGANQASPRFPTQPHPSSHAKCTETF